MEKYNGADILYTGQKNCSQCYFLMRKEGPHGRLTFTCSIIDSCPTFNNVEEAEQFVCNEFHLDKCTGEEEAQPLY